VIHLDGLEKLLPRLTPSDPGLRLAIVGKGRPLFDFTAGVADIRTGRVLHPDSLPSGMGPHREYPWATR
jgi:hypothetical protein